MRRHPAPGPRRLRTDAVATSFDRHEYTVLLHEQRAWIREEMGVDLVMIQPAAAAEYEDPFPAYADNGTEALLARFGRTPVGIAAVAPLTSRTAELKRVFVRARARGLGAGRSLVQHATDLARRAGVERIVLETHRDHMAAAVRLYRACGFVEVAPLGHTSGPGIVTLALDLRAGTGLARPSTGSPVALH